MYSQRLLDLTIGSGGLSNAHVDIFEGSHKRIACRSKFSDLDRKSHPFKNMEIYGPMGVQINQEGLVFFMALWIKADSATNSLASALIRWPLCPVALWPNNS
jgi:hypothetical protein